MAVRAIPEGYHSVTPYMIVDGAAEAIRWYGEAFGATEALRLPMGDKIGHAEIRIGDSFVMLADEWPDMGLLGPEGARRGDDEPDDLRRGFGLGFRPGDRGRSDAGAAGRDPVLRRPLGHARSTRSATAGRSRPMSRTCPTTRSSGAWPNSRRPRSRPDPSARRRHVIPAKAGIRWVKKPEPGFAEVPAFAGTTALRLAALRALAGGGVVDLGGVGAERIALGDIRPGRRPERSGSSPGPSFWARTLTVSLV